MADPRPLFYVTAVVVLGLIVWVASVLLRPGSKWKAVTAGHPLDAPPVPEPVHGVPDTADAPDAKARRDGPEVTKRDDV